MAAEEVQKRSLSPPIFRGPTGRIGPSPSGAYDHQHRRARCRFLPTALDRRFLSAFARQRKVRTAFREMRRDANLIGAALNLLFSFLEELEMYGPHNGISDSEEYLDVALGPECECL